MIPIKGDRPPPHCPACELGLTRFKFNQTWFHVDENDEEIHCSTQHEPEKDE